MDALAITGDTMDEAWDGFCAQVIFGDTDGHAIDARIARAKGREALEAEITALDARVRREHQINRKNELLAQLRAKRRELGTL